MGKSIAVLSILVLILGTTFAWADEPDAFSKTIEIYKKSPQAQPFFENAYGKLLANFSNIKAQPPMPSLSVNCCTKLLETTGEVSAQFLSQ